MHSIYVQQYPTSTLNKYLDYLLYQEQVKKEQEAFYYYRLRQQQQQQIAYLQEQERQKRLLLAYYEQQEKVRQERLLQEELRQRRLALLEQQRRLSTTFPSFISHQAKEEQYDDDEEEEKDRERLSQLVEFLFGPEPSSTTSSTETRSNQHAEPQKTVWTLGEFLNYISKEEESNYHEEQEQASSSTHEPDFEEANKEDSNVIAEHSNNAPVAEEAPELAHEEVVEESVSEKVLEPTVKAEPIFASTQPLTASPSAVQVDDQLLLTAEEFVDYIVNKSKVLFEDNENKILDTTGKQEKLKLLQGIQQELDNIRKDNEQHILSTQLDFSQSDDDSVSATTAENREFLGYEDQIMKVLLKLDTVESDGDDEIRAERKSLVKFAENMLNRLDEFKHKEWERSSVSSHSEVEEEEDEDFSYV